MQMTSKDGSTRAMKELMTEETPRQKMEARLFRMTILPNIHLEMTIQRMHSPFRKKPDKL